MCPQRPTVPLSFSLTKFFNLGQNMSTFLYDLIHQGTCNRYILNTYLYILLSLASLIVIVAGLDMDFKGNPFGPMPNLMAIAEEVLKVHAICVETGRPAGYSYRKDSKEDLVLIGEKKEYEPLSREAFKKKMANKKRT